MQIIDTAGNSRSSGWLYSEYGPVDIRSAPAGSAYRVLELREVVGPSSVVVTVLDKDGKPLEGVRVAWSWPDAPVKDAAAGWDGKLDKDDARTNAEGKVGFGMGRGGYYFPPAKGPHSLWLYGVGVSDYVGGLGMIGLTEHRHLDVTFQWIEAASPTDPVPTPNPYEPTLLGVAVLDADGHEQDAAWLARMFGRVEVHRNGEGYRVAELQEAHGGPMVVQVLDEFGCAMDGVTVSFRHREGIGGGGTAQTDKSGLASFPLSNVHKYGVPAESGPFLVTLKGVNSDAALGLGWVRNTDRHLDVVFQWQGEDDDEESYPDPDPSSSTLSRLLAKLAEAMEGVLEVIAEIQAEIDGE